MALSLEWNDEQDALPIGEELLELLRRLLGLAAEAEGVASGEVAVSFVTDEAIQALNRDYRNLDKPTDVLSFSMLELGEGETEIVYGSETSGDNGDDSDAPEEEWQPPLGDIVISVPRALEQAEQYGHSVEREIGFLFVHGFLHLIGYDHQDEASERIMFGKQEAALIQAGLGR